MRAKKGEYEVQGHDHVMALTLTEPTFLVPGSKKSVTAETVQTLRLVILPAMATGRDNFDFIV